MLPRRAALASLASFGMLAALAAAPLGLGCKRGPKLTKIAVVPKGTTHEFWKAVHAGALKAGNEEHVEIAWNGPLKEDDLKEQIDIVQTYAAQGVAGIVLAPLSDKGLVQPVKGAKASGIPTVIFDSDLQGSEHVSFVATDNFAAGKLAGEALAKLLGEAGGSIVVLRYQEGSASTSNREAGFLEAIKAHPAIKVASESQHGGATVESAHKTAENLLASTKDLRGVFCPNESTTFGMLLALQQAGLVGGGATSRVRFIGFDASEKVVQAVRDGAIDALVLQDPFKIGYLAVKTMARHLRGEKIDARIDTGATLATKQNLDGDAVKALLAPDLSGLK